MSPAPVSVRHVGRYAIYDPIATGGMATVHLGRLNGPVGFARTVAVKRLHAQFAREPEFVTMFLDEARLAARIQHPNVVPTLDVIATDGELFLVMEYVRGESLAKLVRIAARAGARVPPRVVVAILIGALAGLHAAHEAKDEAGRSLGIVHRDVSPQNVLVGIDGVARVLDFGVAKAADTVHVTKDGQLKGKLLYMPPEQLEGEAVDRRSDVYAMGVILFEALTGQRMFPGEHESSQLLKIARGEIRVPSELDPTLATFDPIVRKASARSMAERYATAREMARALEESLSPASAHDVGEWVEAIAGVAIEERTKRIADIESGARLDRDEVRASLATELARTSMPDVAAENSGVSSRRSLPSPEVAPPPPEKKKTPVVALVALAVLLLVGVVAAGSFYLGGRKGDATEPTGVAAALTTSAPPPVSPTPSAEASALANVAPVVPVAASAATADPPPATAKLPIGSLRAAPRPSASSLKPDCEQPYVVDSAGHMHFRRECL